MKKLLKKADTFLYKWLPIVMGCHCRADRSFYIKGRKFPVCARCTGVLAGFLLAPFLFPFCKINAFFFLLFLLPGLADGIIQLKTSYVSNNIRRLWTGTLMGYGSMSLMISSYVWAVRLGNHLATYLAH